jgi:hypothetical protein
MGSLWVISVEPDLRMTTVSLAPGRLQQGGWSWVVEWNVRDREQKIRIAMHMVPEQQRTRIRLFIIAHMLY